MYIHLVHIHILNSIIVDIVVLYIIISHYTVFAIILYLLRPITENNIT